MEISCNIDFTYEGTLVDYVKMMANYSDEIVEDDYGNLRYIGKNPNNYVQFNNELWRIIGVMKDIKNADGTREDKIKLIRNESIGRYSWDNTGLLGSNDWSISALQKVLNEGAYYNRTSGVCPYGKEETTTCNFSSTGLTIESKGMISDVVWNIGGRQYNNIGTKSFYEYERGEEVYSGMPTKWIGKVGLMYPSDYGYATSGGATTDRAICLNTSLGSWNESGVSDCKNNDWLYKNNAYQLTIMPNSSIGYEVFFVNESGHVYSSEANSLIVSNSTRPSVYLNTSIGIDSRGVGSSNSPFVLK